MKIEKGIKRPPVRQGRQPRFPLKDLEKGESFHIRLQDNRPTSKEYDNLQSLMTYYANTYRRTFSLRSEADGVRVWRME